MGLQEFFKEEYFNSLDFEIKKEKFMLLKNWINKGFLDNELLNIYNKIKVDFGMQVQPPINTMLEYSLQVNQLLKLEIIKGFKDDAKNSRIYYYPAKDYFRIIVK